jgi:hypothetical protein
MESIFVEITNSKLSASKIQLLINFANQWSRIDRKERRMKVKRLRSSNRKQKPSNNDSIHQEDLETSNRIEKESYQTSPTRETISETISSDSSESTEDSSFHYSPASPIYFSSTDNYN